MFSSKKGTELSMNVIIIAAIAILVLVILAMFVFRSSERVDKGTGCLALGGTCEYDCATVEGAFHNPGFDKSCNGLNCCMTVSGGK